MDHTYEEKRLYNAFSNLVTVPRVSYFDILKKNSLIVGQVQFNYSDDGLSEVGPNNLTIELEGYAITIKSYLFGLMFLYSSQRPVLNNSKSNLVQDVIHARIGDSFFYYGGNGEYLDFETIIRDNDKNIHKKRYVVCLLDDEESNCFLLTDNIIRTAQGLLSVPNDLDINLQEDLDFEDCEYLDLENANIDRMFSKGSGWQDVKEGGYLFHRLANVNFPDVAEPFRAKISFG